MPAVGNLSKVFTVIIQSPFRSKDPAISSSCPTVRSASPMSFIGKLTYSSLAATVRWTVLVSLAINGLSVISSPYFFIDVQCQSIRNCLCISRSSGCSRGFVSICQSLEDLNKTRLHWPVGL